MLPPSLSFHSPPTSNLLFNFLLGLSSLHSMDTAGQSRLTSVWQITDKIINLFLAVSGLPPQFSSAAQSCLTLCDPMDCSTPGSLSITNSQSLLKLTFIESVMPSNCLILCHPLLLLPSVFPSIRVFSNESVLHIKSIGVSTSASVLPMNTQD